MPDLALVNRLYRSLNFIRRMEERIAEIYPEDKIKSPVHLAIGQESVSVGVCDVLDAKDVVAGTYRSHALYLAKGGDPGAMMAEMYGNRRWRKPSWLIKRSSGGRFSLLFSMAGPFG